MTANEIRKAFLDFFASKGHTIVPSDSLVPKNDPTVLFTTAGMQQFKRQFLGDIEGYTRAASSQKCLRTDDLEEVGETAFHHTFFEMLGNFSFGDYFKKEAIGWGWEFLTGVLGLPPEKLWVSVYKDDTEAEEIWLKDIRLPADRLVRLGDKSNFWPSDARAKGPNGPCGPCSEIFYDYGPNPECKDNNCDPDCNCGRFSEIWNLVFTQFNRTDGGKLEPLPAKNIDTGMGLERLTAVMQDKKNNFDTDLFQPIIAAIEEQVETGEVKLPLKEKRVIADHMRAVVFAIHDGIIPSNKERGSVVKRLINDSTNYVVEHGVQEPSVYKLVPAVAQVMKAAYPELETQVRSTADLILKTEAAFLLVLKSRVPELEARVQELAAGVKENPGAAKDLGTLFFTYRDTYGLPLSVILRTVRPVFSDEAVIIDEALTVYRGLMDHQRERSRASSKMAGDVFTGTDIDLSLPKTAFRGYELVEDTGKILQILRGGDKTDTARNGDKVTVILDRTPFYAESGGQVGDSGVIATETGKILIKDTQKTSDIWLHTGTVADGEIRVGQQAGTRVDEERRKSIMRNHTATHLLQAALREVLGPHVQQQGSLVAEDRLRFDFTHPESIRPDQIRRIEDYINSRVLACDAVRKEEMSLDQAKKSGALAFFAEKYGDTVRVVSVGDYSKEFCGGTHLDSTGEIGPFKITGESAIAQGIRRIEARTGLGTWEWIKRQEDLLRRIADAVKSTPEDAAQRVRQQADRIKALQKDNEKFRFDAIRENAAAIIADAPQVDGIRLIIRSFDDLDGGTLRKVSDLLRQKAAPAVVALGTRTADSAQLLLAVSKDLVGQGVKAHELIKPLAELIGGSGGGRPDMAQAGSKAPQKLASALKQARTILEEKINARKTSP